MPENRWRNGFAVGLGFGLSAATVILIWGSGIYDFVDCIARDQCNGYAGRFEADDEPQWWWWTRRLVASEDTLAQWVMSFFTIVAAGLLVGTLVATQRMAADTRKMVLETTRIGEAQVRAYLTIEKVSVTPRAEQFYVDWDIALTVRNTGQSPARSVMIEVSRVGGDTGLAKGVWPDIAAGKSKRDSVELLTRADDLRFATGSDTRVIMLLLVKVRYEDVFCLDGKTITESAEFAGNALLVDGETTEFRDFSALGREIDRKKKSAGHQSCVSPPAGRLIAWCVSSIRPDTSRPIKTPTLRPPRQPPKASDLGRSSPPPSSAAAPPASRPGARPPAPRGCRSAGRRPGRRSAPRR
ncbi:hypothetical protein C8D95_11067 [Silicimonas algicola]|uniref:Uncharacterized protein n=1 Tax=Silicimonas algicola TaxID=1826607 RepID=A0A316G331_9RHOB|nr:hypothetical protein C8D95_11067 [Silicimonas algicola]